jgi:carbon monoxide dehydrogenase subunit G
MTTIRVEREVATSPEKVWAVITDLDRSPEMIRAIKSVERVGEGSGLEVGTTWKETREMFGREATETMRVTAVDEGRSYTVESDSRGAHYTSVMAVEPARDGSRLSMSFGAEAASLGAKLMSVVARLFEGSTRKAIVQDLDDIAKAVEAVTD